MQIDPFFELFPIMFAVVSLIILGIGALIVVAIVRNYRKVKQSGHDPFTLQADLATRTLDSDLLRPAPSARTMKERLEELEALRAAGTITAEEHATARAEILRGI
jgi:cytochrome c-type biogenesis protein CcmH/NrfG